MPEIAIFQHGFKCLGRSSGPFSINEISSLVEVLCKQNSFIARRKWRGIQLQKILSEKKKKLRFHEALYKIMGVKHEQNVLMLFCSPKTSPGEK